MTMTTKELRREQIIDSVLRAHRISRADLLSACRDADLVSARKAIAHALRNAGFSIRRIGKALNRDQSTIDHYLGYRSKFSLALPNSLKCFPEDIRELIVSLAKASGTTPGAIVTEWITERARFEASRTMEKAA